MLCHGPKCYQYLGSPLEWMMNAEMPWLHVNTLLLLHFKLPCHSTYFCYTNSTCKAGASARLATAVVRSVVIPSSPKYFFCKFLFLSSSLPKYIICKFLLLFACATLGRLGREIVAQNTPCLPAWIISSNEMAPWFAVIAAVTDFQLYITYETRASQAALSALYLIVVVNKSLISVTKV